MFGYIIANRSALSDEQVRRYRGCYCGLCRSIAAEYGLVQRLALNYDMTFLVMLLQSLYEPEEQDIERPCIAHPFRSQYSRWSEITDYGAAMNMALAHLNCLDDWHDDRNPLALAEAGLFSQGARKAAEAYPRQYTAITAGLNTLSRLERENLLDPDAAANAFASLMGVLFLWKDDRWSPQLLQLGEALGRFIYLMDAAIDLPEDRRKGRYNPLVPMSDRGMTLSDFQPLLRQCLGECTEAFEQLPLVQDVDILRNILYSGVWTRFSQAQEKLQEVTHV